MDRQTISDCILQKRFNVNSNVDGNLITFVRVNFRNETNGEHLYTLFFLCEEWRTKGS